MTRTRTRTLQVASLVALLALTGPMSVAADCYTAVLDEPLLTPDGAITTGGEIKVCRVKQLTPAATLHSLSFDGRHAGMFLGTRQSVELDDDAVTRPTILFSRTNEFLEFRAVAYTVGGRYQAFRADRIGRGRVTPSRAAVELALAGEPGGSTLVAVTAAD